MRKFKQLKNTSIFTQNSIILQLNSFYFQIGCLASTIGAGMQSLTSAPRLLQAIATDEVIPFLRRFKHLDSRGEPIVAIFVALFICWIGILIAVIENLTALITQ